MYREEAKPIDQATIDKIVAEAKSCTKSPWDIDLKLHPGDRLYHGHVNDDNVVHLEDSHEVSCEIAGKALECYKEKEVSWRDAIIVSICFTQQVTSFSVFLKLHP